MKAELRLAVRAVILQEDRLLLVNAWPSATGHPVLWCAPGGGVERGSSLPDNLRRELHEECGIEVSVGAPCLINEFHDPDSGFHQVEVFFRCTLLGALPAGVWRDPEGVVEKRGFFARDAVQALRLKPDSLKTLPWEQGDVPAYDALEPLLR